jgi:signal transduction histidine kinase/CheY-like chemotaxis protein
MLGAGKYLLSCVHPDFLNIEQQRWDDFFEKHIPSTTECQVFHSKAQSYIWVKVQRALIDCNETTKFMVTILDIDENKLMEIKLYNETRHKEEAYNHKSVFLTNMSHEIRTPLNGIIGMLTLLEDTKISKDQESYISMIKECSYNLMTIINDILDYSKLEIGKISLDIKPMSLQECVESTNDIILSKIYEKSLEYSYNIEADVHDSFLGDNNRIKQILLNLLSNAIKFTDKGTVFLNIKQIDQDTFGKLTNLDQVTNTDEEMYLRFDITDTGFGIDQKDVDKLFKSFTQIQSKTSSKIQQGTGLGLVISKELTELMGGVIWLDWSAVSKGSRFSFVVKTQSIENTHYITANEDILAGASVLIVDDNLFNRIGLSGMVTKWGMKAYTFSNAEEALYFTKINKFDIGLIDMCMPRMDGTTFAYKLRQQEEFDNRSFPLIALSSIGDKSESISSIFKSHLSKPIKEKQLKAHCITYLSEFKNNIDTDTSEKNLDTFLVANNILDFKDNIRILLVEDIFINQKVIVSFLNKIGFSNINVVEDGQSCIDSVLSTNFDIILLDIRIPVKNGEEVFAEVQQHFKEHVFKRKPYIIAVTAYCLRGDKQKYLDMGFDDYIPKPISFTNLSFCMNTFTEKLLHE